MRTLNESTKEENIQLYHGTTFIEGNQVIVREKPVSHHTLGNGFYTTNNLEAAKLFGYLANRKAYFEDFEHSMETYGALRDSDFGPGKTYSIELDNASILDATAGVNPQQMKQLLLKTGFRESAVNSFSEKKLSNFKYVIELIRHSKTYKGNPYEYAVRAVGYDGLKIKEKGWETLGDYAAHLGLDKGQFEKIPDTVVIYNTAKIKSFKEIQDLTEVKKIDEKRQRPKKKRGLRR